MLNCQNFTRSDDLMINTVQFSILQIRLYPKLSKEAKTYLKSLKFNDHSKDISLSSRLPWSGAWSDSSCLESLGPTFCWLREMMMV
jgi:hypothetical protein